MIKIINNNKSKNNVNTSTSKRYYETFYSLVSEYPDIAVLGAEFPLSARYGDIQYRYYSSKWISNDSSYSYRKVLR